MPRLTVHTALRPGFDGERNGKVEDDGEAAER
jgi:hypothetical protein